MAITGANLASCLDSTRSREPLVHCITNYVTINDCANAVLGCGGSPIMGDEGDDIADITSICDALVINIGGLHPDVITGMFAAGARAGELGHPIILDPVGAGASQQRTEVSGKLLQELPISVVRGNMSEIKAIAGIGTATRGVDVSSSDIVTDRNLSESAAFARMLASKLNTVIAITGAIDVVADANHAIAIRNGVPLMGKITGAGCMLTCLVASYVAANPGDPLTATVAAIAGEGLAGQIAASRMGKLDGNGTFRTYLLDAIFNMDATRLATGALIEEL